MSKKRIDTTAPRATLTDSPFAALGGGSTAPSPADGEKPPAPAPPPAAKKPYRVGKTRKGGWALSIEKRSGGKVATILANVESGGDVLLAALKKRCATGGVYREGKLELQGDQREKVEKFLNEA